MKFASLTSFKTFMNFFLMALCFYRRLLWFQLIKWRINFRPSPIIWCTQLDTFEFVDYGFRQLLIETRRKKPRQVLHHYQTIQNIFHIDVTGDTHILSTSICDSCYSKLKHFEPYERKVPNKSHRRLILDSNLQLQTHVHLQQKAQHHQ